MKTHLQKIINAINHGIEYYHYQTEMQAFEQEMLEVASSRFDRFKYEVSADRLVNIFPLLPEKELVDTVQLKRWCCRNNCKILDPSGFFDKKIFLIVNNNPKDHLEKEIAIEDEIELQMKAARK